MLVVVYFELSFSFYLHIQNVNKTITLCIIYIQQMYQVGKEKRAVHFCFSMWTPFCPLDFVKCFCLLACACLLERSDSLVSRQAHATISKLINIWNYNLITKHSFLEILFSYILNSKFIFCVVDAENSPPTLYP